MAKIQGIRLLNAVILGTTSGAQMQTLLADGPRAAAFIALLTYMPAQCARMALSAPAMAAVAASSTAMTAVAASSTAMTAVAASSTAMTAVIASSTAMAAVAASSTAMTAVIASSTAMAAVAASSTAMTAVNANDQATRIWMLAGTGLSYTSYATVAAVWASNTATDAVFASATARLAVYNADTALAALQANPTQVQRKVTSGATLNTNNWNGAITLVSNGTKIIILRRYYQSAEYDFINWARGSTTSGPGNGPVAGSGGRTLYTSATALGCTSGTYTSNGVMPITNDSAGNFVCAANGLRRDFASSGSTQYVYYIPV